MKKILALSLFALMLFSLTACQANEAENENLSDTQTTQEIEERNYNYLTGEELENDAQSSARPVAVMINNAKQAFPQKGLSSAEVIYEMVTEGGITRLMAMYPDIESVGTVGPVRSARDQFVEFVLPSNAIYVHIGGSRYATEMLTAYNYNNIDGIYLGETGFYFDEERESTLMLSPEHCWFTNSELIAQGAQTNGIEVNGNVYPVFNFNLEEGNTALNGSSAIQIDFSFSEYAPVGFTYSPETNQYLKSAFGVPHIDAETNEQLAFDNVFILYSAIGLKEDLVVPNFNLSQGEGYYFNGGEYIKVTYSKAEARAPLVILDENGEEIMVNVGESYVGIVDVLKKDEILITPLAPEA